MVVRSCSGAAKAERMNFVVVMAEIIVLPMASEHRNVIDQV